MVYVHRKNAHDILREYAKQAYCGKVFQDDDNNVYNFHSFPVAQNFMFARNVKTRKLERLALCHWFGLKLVSDTKHKP